MKNFAFSILCASIVGGILSSLVSKKSKLKKYISFVVTLVCVLSLIQPIITVVKSATELKNTVSSFFDAVTLENKINATNDIIISTSKQRIETGIKDLVTQKYKFNPDEVNVEIILNENDINAIKIDKIFVYITGKASWSDTETIENYLENMVGNEIIVKRR